MSIIIGLFAPQLRQTGFFHEWARFIRTNSMSDVLAAFVLEGLRDAENYDRRMIFTYFTTFIKTRTWPEAILELEEHFDEVDRATLKDAKAVALYDRMRMIISAQFEAYYDQLLEQKDQSRKETRTLIESDPFAKIEAKISMLVETRVQAELGPLAQRLVTELKKYMDEGEGWKNSGDQKP